MKSKVTGAGEASAPPSEQQAEDGDVPDRMILYINERVDQKLWSYIKNGSIVLALGGAVLSMFGLVLTFVGINHVQNVVKSTAESEIRTALTQRTTSFIEVAELERRAEILLEATYSAAAFKGSIEEFERQFEESRALILANQAQIGQRATDAKMNAERAWKAAESAEDFENRTIVAQRAAAERKKGVDLTADAVDAMAETALNSVEAANGFAEDTRMSAAEAAAWVAPSRWAGNRVALADLAATEASLNAQGAVAAVLNARDEVRNAERQLLVLADSVGLIALDATVSAATVEALVLPSETAPASAGNAAVRASNIMRRLVSTVDQLHARAMTAADDAEMAAGAIEPLVVPLQDAAVRSDAAAASARTAALHAANAVRSLVATIDAMHAEVQQSARQIEARVAPSAAAANGASDAEAGARIAEDQAANIVRSLAAAVDRFGSRAAAAAEGATEARAEADDASRLASEHRESAGQAAAGVHTSAAQASLAEARLVAASKRSISSLSGSEEIASDLLIRLFGSASAAQAYLALQENVVRALQMALTDRGLYTGGIDGKAGPGTRGAIERFQREYDLPVNGSPDVATLLELWNRSDVSIRADLQDDQRSSAD